MHDRDLSADRPASLSAPLHRAWSVLTLTGTRTGRPSLARWRVGLTRYEFLKPALGGTEGREPLSVLRRGSRTAGVGRAASCGRDRRSIGPKVNNVDDAVSYRDVNEESHGLLKSDAKVPPPGFAFLERIDRQPGVESEYHSFDQLLGGQVGDDHRVGEFIQRVVAPDYCVHCSSRNRAATSSAVYHRPFGSESRRRASSSLIRGSNRCWAGLAGVKNPRRRPSRAQISTGPSARSSLAASCSSAISMVMNPSA